MKPARCRGRRKPGGQKGHPARHRELQPPERVDETVAVLPVSCRHCDQPLPQQLQQVETRGEVHRYQVTELPPLRAYITEYQCHKVACPHCGRATRAELLAEVRVSAFGPRLAGLIAYLTVGLRIPRRGVEQLLATALGIEISGGSTQKLIEESSEALAATCQELERQLPKEPVLNSDETGWRSMGERRWLWALVASSFVFFTVAASRSSQVLVHLLEAVFPGILCSDRFGAYLKYHKGRAQFCWAHLKRDLLGIQEFARTTDAERFCRDALALVARLFRLWHRFRGGGLDRAALIQKSIPLQMRFFRLCEQHLDSNDEEVRVLATALFQHCDRLFCVPRTSRRGTDQQQRRAGVASCGNLAQGLIRKPGRQRRGSHRPPAHRGPDLCDPTPQCIGISHRLRAAAPDRPARPVAPGAVEGGPERLLLKTTRILCPSFPGLYVCIS